MTPPRTFLGLRTSGAVYESGVGIEDAGEPIVARARTNRVAPGGPLGEAMFYGCTIPITWKSAVTVVVTPYIDGQPGESTTLELPASGTRQTLPFEVSFSVPYRIGGVELARFAPRGAWCQVEWSATGGLEELAIEGCVLDAETVRESRSVGVNL